MTASFESEQKNRENSQSQVGFIGTGIMGSRMASNLMSNRYKLVVHNRTVSKAADLVERGAEWAETPAAAALNTDYLVTMLAYPEAVENAALDSEKGFLDVMRPGAVWIDCSTGNPAFARRMAREAESRGIRFLDAPVAGSKNQAQAAQLVFFVGGEEAVVRDCQAVFDAMGQRVNHVGGHGMGNALKLVINHMLATSMVAFAEGLLLGQSLGLSQEQLLNTLIGGVVTPPFLAGKRAKIENLDFDAEFPLRWMQKDTHMVAETAFQTGTSMPTANIAKEIYQLAVRYGYGDDDFSAVYAFLRRAE